MPGGGVMAGKDFTTKAAGVLETELTAAGIPHDLKVYPGPSTPSSTTSCGSTTRRGGGLLAAGPGLLRRPCPAHLAKIGLMHLMAPQGRRPTPASARGARQTPP